jgi:hypothetical protein
LGCDLLDRTNRLVANAKAHGAIVAQLQQRSTKFQLKSDDLRRGIGMTRKPITLPSDRFGIS